MSGQRARSAVAAEHRSAVPSIPGVPSWAAVLIAATATSIGFAFDAGSAAKELTSVFAAGYVIGCLAAVLAVRQSGLFTAVIQPPLLLFVSVPGAYFLFHGATIDGFKDLLINCGYPLIERFPLMFFTSAAVLLIGMGRWYRGLSSRRATGKEAAHTDDGRFSGLTSKLSTILTRESEDDRAEKAHAPRRRQRSTDRPAKAARTPADTTRTRGGRPVKRTQTSHARHARPPESEIVDAATERPRRPRPTRHSEPPPAEPRRRSRTSSAREGRKQPPPAERRSPYQRPDHRSRFESFDGFEPHGTNGSTGSNGTHHPISRVRYRGADDNDRRTEYRTRPRASRREVDAWEYDI